MTVSLRLFEIGFGALCKDRDEDGIIAGLCQVDNAISCETLQELASIGSSDSPEAAIVDRSIELVIASHAAHVHSRFKKEGVLGFLSEMLRSNHPGSPVAQSYFKGCLSALMVADLYHWRGVLPSAAHWVKLAQLEYEGYVENIKPALSPFSGWEPMQPIEDAESKMEFELAKSQMTHAMASVRNRLARCVTAN
jgi:hypothetical protein